MTFLPIVARELRVSARRRRTYFGRVSIAAAFVALAAFLLPALAAEFSLAQGKMLFSVMSTLAFGYCLLAGARLTSDCISAEKREGTIGLLFLTDLKGYDVILGKLVSCSLSAFYGLLATVPVLALALLLGGVTLIEVGRTTLLFVNTLFFSMAAGVFVSTLSRNDRRATFATGLVIFIVTVAPYMMGWAYDLWRPNALWEPISLLRASPVFAFVLLRAPIATRSVAVDFYASLATTHLLAWMFLAAASLAIPQACRERPPGRKGMRWLEFRNRWSYGRPEKRRWFRSRMLDRNAFYWLAARDRIKAHYVWVFVGALGAIWCWAGWMMSSFIFDWDISFVILFLFFVFVKVWLTSEVCVRLVEDRACGAFELLLSSPLDLRDIARGQGLALRRQFGRPVLLALGLTCLLMLSAVRSPHSGMSDAEVKFLFCGLILMLLTDLTTLKWVALWHSATRSQINRAMAATCGRVLLLPTVLFLVIWTGFVLFQQALGGTPGNDSSGERGLACALWLGIGLSTDLFFGLRARWAFLHHFREVATQRYMAPEVGLAPFMDLIQRVRRVWPNRSSGLPNAALSAAYGKWRWAALVVAAAIGLGLITFGFWRYSLSRAVQRQLAAISARGEPVTIVGLQSWLPAVPDTENAGAALAKAVPYLAATPRYHPRKLEWPGPMAALTPDQRTPATELVKLNQQALALVRAAATLTNSRYPLDWRVTPVRMVSWQMSFIRQAVPVLKFDALLDMESGDTDGALEDIRASLGVARVLQQEPLLPAQQERLEFLDASLAILERLLNQRSLSAAQLQSLADQIGAAEAATGSALARAFVGERCLTLQELRSIGRQRGFWGAGPNGWEQLVIALTASAGELFGVPERRILECLDASGWFIYAAAAIGGTDPANRTWAIPRTPAMDQLSRGGPPRFQNNYWDGILYTQIEMAVRLRGAAVALAVERFRAVHDGKPPSSLGQLVPEFIQSVPEDPFSMAPLHYKLLPLGYVVYSVGMDRHDNGGLDRNAPGSRRGTNEYDLTFTVQR
jgi:hypothetical protein